MSWVDVKRPSGYVMEKLYVMPLASGVERVMTGLALDFLRPAEVEHGFVVVVEDHPSTEALRKLRQLLGEEFVGARLGVLGLDSEPRDRSPVAEGAEGDAHEEGRAALSEAGEVGVTPAHEYLVQRTGDGEGDDVVDSEPMSGRADVDNRHESSPCSVCGASSVGESPAVGTASSVPTASGNEKPAATGTRDGHDTNS